MKGAIASIRLALVLVSSIATAHAASMYSVNEVPLPTALSGGSWNYGLAQSINDRGQVIGTAFGNIGSINTPQLDFEQPVIYSGGTLTKLGPAFGQANAINNTGQVVGMTNGKASIYSGNQIAPIATDGSAEIPKAVNNSGETGGSTGSGQAYINVGGHQTILRTALDAYGSVAALNDAGQAIVNLGASPWSAPATQAFLFDGHNFQPLPGFATGLNASGDVVGTMGSHAYFWDGTIAHDLGTLGGDQSNALAVNAAGVVVGTSLTASNQPHAFVDVNGVMTDLNSLIPSNLGLSLSSGVGINDLGQIVATGKDASGNLVSVVLTPDGVTQPSSPVLGTPTVVPEPSTLAVFALAGLAFWVRRSRRA
jgi:probable HAF family extracellular repeat protein